MICVLRLSFIFCCNYGYITDSQQRVLCYELLCAVTATDLELTNF